MTISPTVTVGTPPLQVDTQNPYMTYATLLNMLGAMVLDIEMIYFHPTNMNQYTNIPSYKNYNFFGNTDGEMLITVPDVNQFNTSLFLGLKGREIAFDGRASLSFNIRPRENIQLYLFGKQIRQTIILFLK